MVLGSASIVALRISLARVSALLLNEDALERGSCSAICYHHLLGVVEHLRVADASRAWILLLAHFLLHLHLLICHVRLSLMIDAL